MSQPLNVAFLWHMHQPYYRDILTGECALPWARLHGLKNYFDIPSIASEFPAIKQTFNLVPSLIKQIEEYAHRGETDHFLLMSQKPASQLTLEDRSFVLHHFFQANADTMIKPFPRYRQLMEMRGVYGNLEDVSTALQRFKDQDLLDLQVWFNLAWCGHTLMSMPSVQALFKKGHGFSEEEKNELLSTQRTFLHQIIPLYRQLQDNGQIEVSISPFYHPILPLLCDTDEAAIAMPDADLPSPSFSHPDDARRQIEASIRFYRDRFGSVPHGMWPSEGSVSPSVVRLAADAGLSWIATDDAILSQSLHSKRAGTSDDNHLSPAQRYRPYKATSGDREIAIVFRDHLLSDHVGFVYSRWDPVDAAEDMVQRLLDIRRQIPKDVSAVVPVILDGENAWEYYAEHGRSFLRALYGKLSDTAELKTVTMQEATSMEGLETIEHLHSGSWIDGNYGTWIGHPEKNAGWQCLQKAREMLASREALAHHRDAESIRNARESLYIAEGSDWFWWYGDDHMSENDAQFDEIFRKHVGNIYRSLGEPIPVRLENSIREPHGVIPTRTPVGPINPSLDGKQSDYYEWLPAGYFDVHGGKGSMHQSDTFLKRIHFGFDNSHLHLRIDTAVPLAEFNGHTTQILLHFHEPKSHSLSIGPTSNGSYVMGMDGKTSDASQLGVGRLVELSVSYEQLEVTPGELLVFDIQVLTGSSILEHWPASGTVSIKVPDPHNNDNWVV